MPFRVIGVYLPVEWSAPGDVKRVKLNKLKEKTEEESSSHSANDGWFCFSYATSYDRLCNYYDRENSCSNNHSLPDIKRVSEIEEDLRIITAAMRYTRNTM